MPDQGWFYHLILVIHVISVLLYFINFLQHNRKINRAAFRLLFIIWGMQTFYFLVQGIKHQALPFLSSFDTLFFYAWLLISLSLLANWFFRMDLLLFFTNVIGFTVMSLSLFVAGYTFPEEMAAQLTSEWVMIHVSMAFFSYAAFTLSFLLSFLFLIQHFLLKKKKWYPRLQRLPNLMTLDLYAFRFNFIAFPLLFLSLILGIIWAINTLTEFVFWDGKVLLSLLVIFMYGTYFYQRLSTRLSAKKSAEWNMLCFGFLLVNYFFSTLFSAFHF